MPCKEARRKNLKMKLKAKRPKKKRREHDDPKLKKNDHKKHMIQLMRTIIQFSSGTFFRHEP